MLLTPIAGSALQEDYDQVLALVQQAQATISALQAATDQLQATLAGKLDAAGGTMTGNLAMSGNDIDDVGTLSFTQPQSGFALAGPAEYPGLKVPFDPADFTLYQLGSVIAELIGALQASGIIQA